jgi:hypothetical protein
MIQHLQSSSNEITNSLASNVSSKTSSSKNESNLKSDRTVPKKLSSNSKPLTPSSALFDFDVGSSSNLSNLNNPPSYTTSSNLNNNNNNNNNKITKGDLDSSATCSDNDDRNTLSSTLNSNITNNSRRFSFNKRPVSKSSKLQRKSSQISFIHNYPPQRCDSINKDIDHTKFYKKYKGILKDKDELPDNALNDLSFEYNYDEKIRAPRMSVVSLISKDSLGQNPNQNPNHLNKSGRQTSAPAIFKINSNSSSNNTLDSLPEETNTNRNTNNDTNINSYKPASYDLTQKLRKFSLSNNDNNYNDSYNDSDLFDENTNNFNNNANHNFYSSRKKSFVSQSSSNISPTKERVSKFEDNINDLKPIKQIDEPIKLLNNYVPPVLRPIQLSTLDFQKKVEQDHNNNNKNKTTSNNKKIYNNQNVLDSEESTSDFLSNNSNSNEKVSTTPPSSSESQDSSLNSYNAINNINLKSPKLSKLHSQLLTQLKNKTATSNSLQSKVSSLDEQQTISETLNSLSATSTNTNSNHSTESGDKGSNFKTRVNKNIEPSHSHWKPNSEINSCENCNINFTLFRRKHHCRHCGSIFCSKCLQQFSNLNLLGHFEKPDDSNSLTNYHNTLLPIKSTETAGTFTTINSITTNNTLSYTESNKLNHNNSSYSTFCKVCPPCYNQWLEFLASDEDWEGKNSNYLELHENKARKESIGGVPNDWNWSSF